MIRIVLLALVILTPRFLAAEEFSVAQRQELAAVVERAIKYPGAIRGGRDLGISLLDWSALQLRGSILASYRELASRSVTHRPGLVSAIRNCLLSGCARQKSRMLLEELAVGLHFSTVLHDPVINATLADPEHALANLALQVLESKSEFGLEERLVLARELLLVSNLGSDRALRLKVISILEQIGHNGELMADVRRDLAGHLAYVAAVIEAYQSSAERRWLYVAIDQLPVLQRAFDDRLKGAEPCEAKPCSERAVLVSVLVRLANLSGRSEYRKTAERIQRELMACESRSDPALAARLLLNSYRLTKQPLHITIVGSKRDPKGYELYQKGLSARSVHMQLEWIDRDEGSLPPSDLHYPRLKRAAAYVCVEKKCSLPIFEAQQLLPTVEKMTS